MRKSNPEEIKKCYFEGENSYAREEKNSNILFTFSVFTQYFNHSLSNKTLEPWDFVQPFLDLLCKKIPKATFSGLVSLKRKRR